MKVFHYFYRGIQKIYNWYMLKKNNVRYLNKPDIRGKIYIRNLGKITLGDDVTVNSGLFPNPVGGGGLAILVVDPHAELRIGNHVGISNAEIVVKQKIEICDGVMIGGGVKIYDSDFHPIRVGERKKTPNAGICKPVFIQENAFIGAGAIVLKGVSIGKNSVVGAGSVVTKDIPDNEIWAGNPARRIGSMV